MASDQAEGNAGQTNWGFWNIHGLKNKFKTTKTDKETCEIFKNWVVSKDVVVLTETWVTENEWESLKTELPEGFEWRITSAVNKENLEKENEEKKEEENKKEQTKKNDVNEKVEKEEKSDKNDVKNMKSCRAMGGIVVGVKTEWGKFNSEEKIDNTKNNKCSEIMIIEAESSKNKEIWHIGAIYNRKETELDNMLNKLETWTNKNKGAFIMGGDWNIHVGELDGGLDETGNAQHRKSEDTTFDANGKKWMDWSRKNDWHVLNGCTKGDLDGKHTYPTYRSVIDLVSVKGIDKKRIIKFEVETEYKISDHYPLGATIRNKEPESHSDKNKPSTSK